MRLYALCVLALVFFACETPAPQRDLTTKTQSLNSDWTFVEKGKSNWQTATVPGVVQLDLLTNGQIDAPYFEQNEEKLRWIEEKDWSYKSTFNVDNALLEQENIEINFEGLDTYAEVVLNGKTILNTDNMFRTWTADVKPMLVEGVNELQVHFQSPIERNRTTVENYPHTLPSGNETADIETKVYSHTRKAAYQFGWDWGPRFVTSGIWRPVSLEAWNHARIIDAYTTTQSLSDQKASMHTEIELEVTQAGDYELVIDNQSIQKHLEVGQHVITHDFEIANPELWWCNGLGKPHLYEQQFSLTTQGQALDEHHLKYGVRTIELINEPDSIGTAFFFKLNGKPVFMQGANYIPQDVLLPRVKAENYEQVLGAAKEAHMNMIRVWGGGIYEQDLFYELCDQKGLLVWQDFMFAGSLYPDSEAFKATVAEEIAQNVKRLRQRPCIALWCGNNEIEVAWKNWGWQKQYGYSSADSVEIWNNYLDLFHRLIPEQLAAQAPTAIYTPTSPLSNWGTAENFNHSSMHYWGVWHGREPFENFETNVGRFMVEYGFQSFPDVATLKKVMHDTSLTLESVAMKHRQKSYIGNGLIVKHVEQYYDSPTGFADFVVKSQQAQALGMQMAIEAHKNKQPHCMGTLFWQLNDCWPGPSWSVLDYYGNKKLAYKTVKEAFAK